MSKGEGNPHLLKASWGSHTQSASEGSPHPTRCSGEVEGGVGSGVEEPRSRQFANSGRKRLCHTPEGKGPRPPSPLHTAPPRPACALGQSGARREKSSMGLPTPASDMETTAPWAEKPGAPCSPETPLGHSWGMRRPLRAADWTAVGARKCVCPPPTPDARKAHPAHPAREPGSARRLGSRRGSSPLALAQTGIAAFFSLDFVFSRSCFHCGKEIPAWAERLQPAFGPVSDPGRRSPLCGSRSEIHSGRGLRGMPPERAFQLMETWCHILFSRLTFRECFALGAAELVSVNKTNPKRRPKCVICVGTPRFAL
ncbi:hypothetical protein HPG69_004359 [Diceros bicornis minor]|uniref:Uncharacterized protein n=1 Tax=Diceros bicornis minor TaxID=77932 RepID=A0A7J7E6R9_DICBM|nr:hypothetical protein HPG69_004359 [Diceros bicornis minor]